MWIIVFSSQLHIDRLASITRSCVTTVRVCDLLRQTWPLINQHELLAVSLTESLLIGATAQARSGDTASCRPGDECIFSMRGLFICSLTSDHAYYNTVRKCY